MRALILAAGQGTRLRPLTNDKPKGLVPLAGRSLLEHQIDTLRRAGFIDIGVATGYRADAIEALGLPTFHNPRFDTTNMVRSLLCADAWLDGSDELLVCYGDIVYTDEVVAAIAACDGPLATTVDTDWQALWEMRNEDPLHDAETMKIEDGFVRELGGKPAHLGEIEAQYMGLIRFGASLAQRLPSLFEALGEGRPEAELDNLFMTDFLQHLTRDVEPMRAVPVHGGWVEVDTVADLGLYEERLAHDGHVHGWRPA